MTAAVLEARARAWFDAHPGPVPGRLDWLAQAESTNSVLLQRVALDARGEALLAEQQTAGRGRLGRRWQAEPGGSLCLSLGLPWPEGPRLAATLSLAIAAASGEVLRELGAGDVGLKWPNDLWARGRKLGGLLLELGGSVTTPSMVIGLGLNLDLPEQFSPGQDWIDLARLLAPGGLPDRAELAARLLRAWLQAIEQLRAEGAAPLLTRWRTLDALAGQTVRVQAGDLQRTGRALGIDAQGRLRVAHADGECCYSSAEISLRPA